MVIKLLPICDMSKFKITSRFGSRPNPITGVPGQQHNGIDFGVPLNTLLVLPISGVVHFSFDKLYVPEPYPITDPAKQSRRSFGQFAYMDVVDGDKIFQIFFAHLNATLIPNGKHANAGDSFALSGGDGDRSNAKELARIGSSTGPHCHVAIKQYELGYINGKWVDPEPFFA